MKKRTGQQRMERRERELCTGPKNCPYVEGTIWLRNFSMILRFFMDSWLTANGFVACSYTRRYRM